MGKLRKVQGTMGQQKLETNKHHSKKIGTNHKIGLTPAAPASLSAKREPKAKDRTNRRT
jgi:hypothetical protein